MEYFRELILCIIVVCAYQAKAQDTYRPYLEEGKVWEFMCDDNKDYRHHYLLSMVVDGDTIVNGRECKRVFLSKEDSYTYFASMYEENKKVYYFLPDHEDAILFYDFNLETGGTTPFLAIYTSLCGFVFADDLTVGGMDYLISYNIIYRRYHLYCEGMDINIVVEGIGTFEPIIEGLVDENGWEFYMYLNACYDGDGKKIFDEWGFYEPAISSINSNLIDNTQTRGDNTIYDLQGRRVTAPQKGGLYIRNGRKFIVH